VFLLNNFSIAVFLRSFTLIKLGKIIFYFFKDTEKAQLKQGVKVPRYEI